MAAQISHWMHRHVSLRQGLISGLMLLWAWFAQPSWAAGWSQYGGIGGQQYTPLTQIDAENVKELRELWRFRTGDLGQGFRRKGHSMQANPVLWNNTLYVSTSANWVVAVDAVSGAEK
ncbi:MAG: PQQ-binding-like beta-propeller repeat protein [Pseudomonadota bacterium]|nr:PQQ-binding-like beta-propeller repeat protein [Pseudomonadota bacterium]